MRRTNVSSLRIDRRHFVSEIDQQDETHRPTAERLAGHEEILERRLHAHFQHSSRSKQGEVLDVVGIIQRITNRTVDRLDENVLLAVVPSADDDACQLARQQF